MPLVQKRPHISAPALIADGNVTPLIIRDGPQRIMCNDAPSHTIGSSTEEVQQIYESCGFELQPGRSFFFKKGVVMGVFAFAFCLAYKSLIDVAHV